MLVECIKVHSLAGSGFVQSGVKKNQKSRDLGSGRKFKNLGFGMGLVTQKAELLLLVKIGKREIVIPISQQFREKFEKPGRSYAQLGEKRIMRIKETMPSYVNIRQTIDSYRVEDQDIDSWFLKL